MTYAELLAAVAAAIRAVFGNPWAVHDNAPDSTKLPAVWPQFDNGAGPVARLAPCTFVIVAAIAPQTAAAEARRVADALDRLTSARWPLPVADQRWSMVDVQIGGVDHTAVGYQLTLSLPIC